MFHKMKRFVCCDNYVYKTWWWSYLPAHFSSFSIFCLTESNEIHSTVAHVMIKYLSFYLFLCEIREEKTFQLKLLMVKMSPWDLCWDDWSDFDGKAVRWRFREEQRNAKEKRNSEKKDDLLNLITKRSPNEKVVSDQSSLFPSSFVKKSLSCSQFHFTCCALASSSSLLSFGFPH